MRSLEDIIEDWKIEFGLLKQGHWGPYYCIDYKHSKDLILNLVATLRDEGYKREAFYKEDGQVNAFVQKMVVDACHAPSELKSTRTKSKIKVTKDMVAAHWKFALRVVFKNPVSSYVPEVKEAYEPTVSVSPIAETSNEPHKSPFREMKTDFSKIRDVPYDEEILAELAAIGTHLDER